MEAFCDDRVHGDTHALPIPETFSRRSFTDRSDYAITNSLSLSLRILADTGRRILAKLRIILRKFGKRLVAGWRVMMGAGDAVDKAHDCEEQFHFLSLLALLEPYL